MLPAPVRDIQKALTAYKQSNRSAPSPGVIDNTWGAHTEAAFIYWANAADSGILSSVRNGTAPTLLERIRATRISADKHTVSLDDQLYSSAYVWQRRYRAPVTPVPAPTPNMTPSASDVGLPPDIPIYTPTAPPSIPGVTPSPAPVPGPTRAPNTLWSPNFPAAASTSALLSNGAAPSSGGMSPLTIGLLIAAGVAVIGGAYYLWRK